MASIHKKKLRSGAVVWELTHGKGPARVRFTAGKTKEEAEAALALFKRQLAVQEKAPQKATVRHAVGEYRAFLELHRSAATARRYGRVLETFAECFLPQFHPQIVYLRDIKAGHLEEYKRRRLEGEIVEDVERLEAEARREQELREKLAALPTAPRRCDNAAYGWLGRKRLKRV